MLAIAIGRLSLSLLQVTQGRSSGLEYSWLLEPAFMLDQPDWRGVWMARARGIEKGVWLTRMRRAAVTAAHEAEVEQDLQSKRDNEATQVAERLAKMTLVTLHC